MYGLKQAAILSHKNLEKTYNRMDTILLPTLWDSGNTRPNQ